MFYFEARGRSTESGRGRPRVSVVERARLFAHAAVMRTKTNVVRAWAFGGGLTLAAACGGEVAEIEQCCRPSVDEHAARIERHVRRNGEELVGREPGLKGAVGAYLKRLDDSRKLLTGPIRPTLFVIRR